MALSSGWHPRPPLVLIAIWAYALAHVGAQQPPRNPGPDPVENFCMRWWSQSIVKNNILYIDSGVQRFNDSGDVYLGINNYLLTIDMTQTWDWQLPSNESGGLSIIVERKNVTSPSTGTAVPNLIRGHLFHGPPNKSDTVYNFGGTTYMKNQSFEGYRSPDSSQYPLWTYDRTLDSPWDKHTIQQVWLPNHGAAAEDTERGVGFYLGGQIDMGTSTLTLGPPFKDPNQNLYMPLDGMLIINLVDLDVRANNISTSSMKRNSPRVGGTMEYIDAVGDGGILLALGGQVQPGLKFGEIANRTKGELIDFNTVDVFDLDSYFSDTSSNGTWYEQTTTGDIPAPRIDFCTIYVSAPDNSSHHIYLYSGFDPISNKSYDDVAVLSLPSFTWTTLFDNGGAPRLGHNCHRVGKRQMVTVGGNVTTLSCDWELKGVAFLELSAVKWGSVFYSNITDTEYDVPNQLLSVTGGNANGGATANEPEKGWTEKGLGDVFRKSRYTIPSTWPTPNNSTGTGDAAGPKKTNVGAVAGGVVGGVAGLALVAGILFVLQRRRRRRAKRPSELHGNAVPRPSDDEKKDKYELRGVNSSEPAELPGPEAQELNAPREFVEADRDTATWASELPATNTVAGGVHGVPIVRTPGDELPEGPEYTPGLRRPASAGGRQRTTRTRRSSTSSSSWTSCAAIETAEEVRPESVQQPVDTKHDDYFGKPATGPSAQADNPRSGQVSHTPHEQPSPPEAGPVAENDAGLLHGQASPPGTAL
ncbi:hypothetical protein PMIN07_001401 [Paraphaeosphaeria minitans]|uniref:Cell wall anchored protein n=1 Tax=Paraphaeosphaeria minitans TaxID=565426 RepID=A0A9P6KVZ1_9PLEO|nr:cell wall anchored protein [Paraphaeosphaeria minitans]